jgi:WD40 repeat protein
LVRDHLEFVLTGGVDGIVRLWNVETGRCVREFETQPGHEVKISHICCEPGSCIVAGASTGEIYVWKVNVNAIVAGRSEDVSSSEVATPGSTDSPDQLAKVIKLPEEFQGVRHLDIDCGANRSGLILAQATDGNVLHLYSLDTLTHLATLKSPVHGTPISAVYWSVPKYERSIISASNGPSNGATHSLHKRHDKSSLIATGDHAGNVCLWYLSESMRRRMTEKNDHTLHPNQLLHDPQILEPNFALKAHDIKVTSLFVDALVIITGR